MMQSLRFGGGETGKQVTRGSVFLPNRYIGSPLMVKDELVAQYGLSMELPAALQANHAAYLARQQEQQEQLLRRQNPELFAAKPRPPKRRKLNYPINDDNLPPEDRASEVVAKIMEGKKIINK